MFREMRRYLVVASAGSRTAAVDHRATLVAMS